MELHRQTPAAHIRGRSRRNVMEPQRDEEHEEGKEC
jgi:hypothetical protein